MSTKPISDLSFEEALAELEQITKTLESGSNALEQSIELYERGTKLNQHCTKKLNDAKLKVEKVTKQSDGSLKTEEFGQK